jgi:hypothetical protein
MTMPMNSAIILVFGVFAMFSDWLPMKLGFYFCGVFFFSLLVYQMHRCVVESTGGAESLFWGSSSIRILSVIVAWTWVPFPIWYALSPEGFNIIQNSAAMKIAVAFLNVLSKGAFMYYLMRVRGDLEVKEMVMQEANAINGADSKSKFAPYGVDEKPEESKISSKLNAVVFDVLQSMGRQADHEPLKEVLEHNMITTHEDLLVLTQSYCESIGLPYGFVTACKTKIRQHRVDSQDKWNLTADKNNNNENFDTVSVATAPLPPQVANDPRKLAEHNRRNSMQGKPIAGDHRSWDDGMSDGGVSARTPRPENRYPEPTSPTSPRNQGMSKDDLQAAIASSQNVLLNELREMKRSQMEEHSRIRNLEEKVEGELDAVQNMMGGMMTQVMDKIESRLRSSSPRAQGNGRDQSVNPFGGNDRKLDPVSFSEINNA